MYRCEGYVRDKVFSAHLKSASIFTIYFLNTLIVHVIFHLNAIRDSKNAIQMVFDKEFKDKVNISIKSQFKL